MFCPQCGSTQPDELNFCKSCGANLGAVREAVQTGQAPVKFDWTKTWVAEMLQSSEASVRKERELELLKGITPDVKRRNEIKAGVITASVGVGVMITVYMVLQGVILGGFVPPNVAEILSRVWIAGVIPMLVGFALIFNGIFIAKRGDETTSAHPNSTDTPSQKEFANAANVSFLEPPPNTNPLASELFSVTDQTTQHLKETVKRK